MNNREFVINVKLKLDELELELEVGQDVFPWMTL